MYQRFKGFRGFRGFRGGWIALRAMLIKPALRKWPLCLQCCMTNRKGPLPQEGGPKGETTHYILCVALLLQNVFAVHAVRRRRIGASLEKRFLRLTGPSGRRVLRFDSGFAAEGCGIALSGDEYEACVTFLLSRLPFVILSASEGSR